jgi:hypothetical protein
VGRLPAIEISISLGRVVEFPGRFNNDIPIKLAESITGNACRRADFDSYCSEGYPVTWRWPSYRELRIK